MDPITSRVYARIGLLGNPSDGFEGACISVSIKNFWAQVTLTPAPAISFQPNPACDPTAFEGPDALVAHLRGCGFYGGVRLMQATCLRFFEYCRTSCVALRPSTPGFSISYTTTIPRQRGLSGSSAICTATLNCLLRHYGVEGAVPVADRPQLLLEAERELGITAGLQDRVIQVYGGVVHMDFTAGVMQERERGAYTSLDPSLLPPLHIIYRADGAPGKDSGGVHSDVRQQWLAGNTTVRHGMRELAAVAEEGRRALLRADYEALAGLIKRNFQLRRTLYSDAVVGADNLEMVSLAESVAAAAKMAGSGGAVVALCPHGKAQVERLRAACRQAGYECVPVEVGPQLHVADGS